MNRSLQTPVPRRVRAGIPVALFGLILAVACRQDMHDQPRYEPFERSEFFADGRSVRPQVPGTVARGQLRTDEHFFSGQVNGQLVRAFPFPITQVTLERGREQFDIFCSPCHGRLGDGGGIVPQRGFARPPTFHMDRLREAPAGHLFGVISNGLGAMADFSDRITSRDRWAIVAYIRALQLSQRVDLSRLPVEVREEFSQSVEQ